MDRRTLLLTGAALEQLVPLVVVGVQVADDQHLRRIVVDQRTLGMLALGVAGVRQALSDDVAAEGDAARRVPAPLFDRSPALEARARGR